MRLFVLNLFLDARQDDSEIPYVDVCRYLIGWKNVNISLLFMRF